MQTFLTLASLPVAFFIILFAGGALIGLARLGLQALRARGSSQDVQAEVTESRPVQQPARRPEPVPSETLVEVGPVCVPA